MDTAAPAKRPKVPGSGRVAGTPNKATVQRRLLEARIASELMPGRVPPGEKLAKEHLGSAIKYYEKLMAHYQPATPTNPNGNENIDYFFKALEGYLKAAAALAPYQSPTLKAMEVKIEDNRDENKETTRYQTVSEIKQQMRELGYPQLRLVIENDVIEGEIVEDTPPKAAE